MATEAIGNACFENVPDRDGCRPGSMAENFAHWRRFRTLFRGTLPSPIGTFWAFL